MTPIDLARALALAAIAFTLPIIAVETAIWWRRVWRDAGEDRP